SFHALPPPAALPIYLPNHAFTLIPEPLLWHTSSPNAPPQVTSQPQSQSVSVGSAAVFAAQVQGAEPLDYRWLRNGLYLSDDVRRSEEHTSELQSPYH